LPTIDGYTYAAVPLWLRFGETPLGHATGFLWRTEAGFHLITNWHVVSGRHPETLRPLDRRTGGVPDRLSFWKRTLMGKLQEITVDLYSDDEPTWLIHPQQRRKVDIVAIPIDPIRNPYRSTPLNDLSDNRLIRTTVGSSLFILGHPFTPSSSGADRFAIWKSATIASEPELTPVMKRFILVDSASRPGMSGSPVIQRVLGLAEVDRPDLGEDATEMQHFTIPQTKLIGVYSGRLHTNSEIDAQLGMVWPISFVREVVTAGSRDTDPSAHWRERRADGATRG